MLLQIAQERFLVLVWSSYAFISFEKNHTKGQGYIFFIKRPDGKELNKKILLGI